MLTCENPGRTFRRPTMHGGSGVVWSGSLVQLAYPYAGMAVLNADLISPLEQCAKAYRLLFPIRDDAMHNRLR